MFCKTNIKLQKVLKLIINSYVYYISIDLLNYLLKTVIGITKSYIRIQYYMQVLDTVVFS